VPITFNNLEAPTSKIVQALAAGVGMQLWMGSSIVRSLSTGVAGIPINQYFNKGDVTYIKRIKDAGAAQDYDPRSGVDATTLDAEYTTFPLTLERLFTKGYAAYAGDALVNQYMQDCSEAIGGGIRASVETYAYTKNFRDYSTIPTVGTANLDAIPPLMITWRETSTGLLDVFGDDHLLDAAKILDKLRVPFNSRYGRVSPDAGRGIESNTTLVTGFAGAQADGLAGRSIITDGIALDTDFMRRGFSIAKSNAITGQLQVPNIGDGTATSTVTAAVPDTTIFMAGDTSVGGVGIPVGAVRLTIGVAAPTLNAGVAVGTIARLGAVGLPALAYGLIIRVDPAGKFVWIMPCNAGGSLLVAAQIPAATVFSIPAIGSVNPFYHSEAAMFTSRLLTMPTPGSGAYCEYAIDPQTQLVSQVFKGAFNVHQFKEGVRGASLVGTKPADWRKGALALAA
jgi:hypothetical protein